MSVSRFFPFIVVFLMSFHCFGKLNWGTKESYGRVGMGIDICIRRSSIGRRMDFLKQKKRIASVFGF